MATLRITQRRSVIGTRQAHRATLQTLGLKKIGQSVDREDSDPVRGMLRSVAHLISFEEVVEAPPVEKPAAKPVSAAKKPEAKAATKTAAAKTESGTKTATKKRTTKAKTATKTKVAAAKKPAAKTAAKKPAKKAASSSKSRAKKAE